MHPFGIVDSAPQTSAQVASQLQTTIEASEAFAQRQQFPARPAAMTKVHRQVPALAALVDEGWQGVRQALASFRLSPRWRQGVYAGLLPMAYGECQLARTRCRRRKAQSRAAWEAARTAWLQHAITQRLAPPVLADWQAWTTARVRAFQRPSSAVEGRHGALARLHQNQRGLPRRRAKVWTLLHNFDCRATEGTTPASRFFGQAFPDLFETVLAHIADFPRPRQRRRTIALCA